MTADQRKIARLCAAVVVVMSLFPPWKEMGAGSLSFLERSRGRAFLFASPTPNTEGYVRVGIDWAILLTQALVVALVLAALLWIFRTRAGEAGLSFSDRLRRRALPLALVSGCLLPFPTGHGAPVIMMLAYSLVSETGHIPRWSLIIWSFGTLVCYSMGTYGLALLASRLLRPAAPGEAGPHPE